MKYKIGVVDLPVVRKYLIDLDLEMHKEFEMKFELTSMRSGYYLLDFFHDQDALAFELKFAKEVYEKN